MNYTSTRTADAKRVGAADAIRIGLAPDGGLYLPESFPVFEREFLQELITDSYPVRAAKILSRFLTDYTYEELLADTSAAYAEEKFGKNPAPVKALSDMYVLELFHGPTCAFKDMALQLMPRLFVRSLRKGGEDREALILVATSGDTGKAALEGYKDIDGTKIQVYYPIDGVSRIQKLQMQTASGSNVSVLGIYGNFDDAQSGVKRIFSDEAMREALDREGVFLSSANSINWGRLAPQIVYYVSAYCDMVKDGYIAMGEPIDICVPTGNFGNIFAAYIGKLCGIPFGTFVCASNKNNILTDFLESGTYDRRRPFHTTMSPSMDILISSNLERLIYLCAGPERTKAAMDALNRDGVYTLDADVFEAIHRQFEGFYADEAETAATIRDCFENQNYLTDTHTAVAVCAARKYMRGRKAERKMLTVSTASAYKFAGDVYTALTGERAAEGTEALKSLQQVSGVQIPTPLTGLDERPVRFGEAVNKDDMAVRVLAFAKTGNQ